jgi:hypothetical protein
MRPAELGLLAPWFTDGERYLNGKVIDWSIVNFKTMFWVKRLREALDEPILLIRGPHPGRPEAVDACCPTVPLSRLFLALTRIPECSWGVYSGNSFHVDTRDYQYKPARWMAVKDREAEALREAGFAELVTNKKDGWLYLAYDHPKAFEALTFLFRLAEA